MDKRLEELLVTAGAFQFGEVPTDKIVFSPEVRKMCEADACRRYGKAWSCPPALGTVEECMEKCMRFKTICVFSVKHDLEDSFDIEGMEEGMTRLNALAAEVNQKAGEIFPDYMLMANEGCEKCDKCTYPDEACRFPGEVHGSIEGYGIFVNKLAASAGINYINGQNTVTYFGAILY